MPKDIKSIQVVLGLTLHNSQVLLCKRNEKELPDIDQMWEIPGGKPEIGENPKETAVRELYEETGYTVIAEDYVHFPYIVTRKYRDFDLIVNVICIICRLEEGGYKAESNDKKIVESRWFNFEEINLMNVIAGSREFLAWSIPKIANAQNAFNLIRHISNIVFENIDQKKNSYKYYFIQCEYEPSSKISYKIHSMWGRITKSYTGVIELLLDGGSFNFPNKTKTTSHENFESFSKELINIMNKRAKHNYYIIDYSTNFPIKSWIIEHQDIVTSSKFTQQSLDIFT